MRRNPRQNPHQNHWYYGPNRPYQPAPAPAPAPTPADSITPTITTDPTPADPTPADSTPADPFYIRNINGRLSSYDSTNKIFVDIKVKVDGFYTYLKNIGRIDHKIKCSDYEKVYVLSDLHSDLQKFIKMLNSTGIIQTVDPYNINGDLNPTAADIALNTMFFLSEFERCFMTNLVWKAESKVLLIIVGDLVDGQRWGGDSKTTVDDMYGNLEFLLHCFIHNLRIKALNNGSEVLFTIGNHDYHSVLSANDKETWEGFDYSYITDRARGFYNNPKKRFEALSPFYRNSPYLFLSLMSEQKEEVRLTHASMAPEGTADYYNIVLLNKIQEEINGGRDIVETVKEYEEPGFDKDVHFLWSRGFTGNNISELTDRRQCTPIGEDDPILIVGHCVTWNGDKTDGKYFGSLIKDPRCFSNDIYSKEYKSKQVDPNVNRLCVIADCEDPANNIFKRYFVDTGLSRAMHVYKPSFTNRIPEMLLLTHTDTGTDTGTDTEGKPSGRYYDKIVATTGQGDTRSFETTSTESAVTPIDAAMTAGGGNIIHLGSCCNCGVYSRPKKICRKTHKRKTKRKSRKNKSRKTK
jgi:hypothetical protein